MKRLAHSPHCTACAARSRGLFSSLTGAQLLKLDRTKTAHEYSRGQVIFYEGNPPLAVYCISSGVVKLYKTGKRDKKVVIRLLGAGETLGFRAVIANEPYAATAEAAEKTTVCAIPREIFDEVIRNDTDTAFRLISKLAAELRISEDEFVSRMQLYRRAARGAIPPLDARESSESLEGRKPDHPPAPARGDRPDGRDDSRNAVPRVPRPHPTGRSSSWTGRSIVVANPRALRRLVDE